MDRHTPTTTTSGGRLPALALGALFVASALSVLVPAAAALPSSVNVAFIGSEASINGGSLQHASASFSGFTFGYLAPGSVTAGSLAAFDTVVLNVASPAMSCTTSTLSAASKTAINGFVLNGGKLVIYDPECTPSVDYSWLVYPFTTSNPGAAGASGTLTIVEENSLSCSPTSSPCYVNVNAIATGTDAAGDSNVVITQDPHWCKDLEVTNVNGVTGVDHMYAHYGAGLFLYNGLDIDQLSNNPTGTAGADYLAKLWLLELKQPWNPSGLPCNSPIVDPQKEPGSADCVAYGVRVIERDLTTGKVIGDFNSNLSRSIANTSADDGAWPVSIPPVGSPPVPPANPQAHADAQQAGFFYSNVAAQLTVSSSTIFSQCDVTALRDPVKGVYSHAYGRGGIQDLSIKLGTTLDLHAEVLDFEAMAIGTPPVTYASTACEITELKVVSPAISNTQCTAPWTTPVEIHVPNVLDGALTFNEQWGPLPAGVSHWGYGGDVAHLCLEIDEISRIDVYVGLVNVGATGGNPLLLWPPMPDPCEPTLGPCLIHPALCTIPPDPCQVSPQLCVIDPCDRTNICDNPCLQEPEDCIGDPCDLTSPSLCQDPCDSTTLCDPCDNTNLCNNPCVQDPLSCVADPCQRVPSLCSSCPVRQLCQLPSCIPNTTICFSQCVLDPLSCIDPEGFCIDNTTICFEPARAAAPRPVGAPQEARSPLLP